MIRAFWKSQGRNRRDYPSSRQFTGYQAKRRQGGFPCPSSSPRLPRTAPRTRAPRISSSTATTRSPRLPRTLRRTRARPTTSSCTGTATRPTPPRTPRRTRATRATTSSCTARLTRRSRPRHTSFRRAGLPGSSRLTDKIGAREAKARSCGRLVAQNVGEGGEEREPRLLSLVRERLDRLGELRGGHLPLVEHRPGAPPALEQVERDRRLVGEQPEQLHLLEREPRALGPVEHLEHAEDALFVEQGHGHQALGHVAGRLGDVARVARIV